MLRLDDMVLPDEIPQPLKKDISFLEGLRKKISWDNGNFKYNRGINSQEIKKVLGLLGSETGLILQQVFFKYSGLGYSITHVMPVPAAKPVRLLEVMSSQLPKSYTFDKLSKVFLNEENLRLMEEGGLEKPREEGHYCY